MSKTRTFGSLEARSFRRLILQSRNLRPITTRLLRDGGLEPGMRVVDLGCGVGDVRCCCRDGSPTGRSWHRSKHYASSLRARERGAPSRPISEFIGGNVGDFVAPELRLAIGATYCPPGVIPWH